LHRVIIHGNACSAIGQLLSRDTFLVTLLAAFMLVATLSLGALVYVQCANVAANLVCILSPLLLREVPSNALLSLLPVMPDGE
jgi:hypothetical protein